MYCIFKNFIFYFSVLKSLKTSSSILEISLVFFQIPDLLSNEHAEIRIKIKMIEKDFLNINTNYLSSMPSANNLIVGSLFTKFFKISYPCASEFLIKYKAFLKSKIFFLSSVIFKFSAIS